MTTQRLPRLPRTIGITYTEAKYALRPRITTQRRRRPPRTTHIAYTEAKYALRSNITTQRPPSPPKTTYVPYIKIFLHHRHHFQTSHIFSTYNHCIEVINACLFVINLVVNQQGRIHGYLSRVRLGRGSTESLQASKQRNTRSKIR